MQDFCFKCLKVLIRVAVAGDADSVFLSESEPKIKKSSAPATLRLPKLEPEPKMKKSSAPAILVLFEIPVTNATSKLGWSPSRSRFLGSYGSALRN